MNQIFYDAVGNNPIIAAVKNMEDIEVSCTIEEIQVIFILFGDVCSIDRIVKRVKDAGKVAMVHVDLISGLSPKEISVEYLKEHTEADGIISTKPSLIKKAKELGMYTVLRYFLLDSMAFENIRQQQHMVRPDFIEVLPGVMPRVIKRICGSVKTPIIAGGLITDKEDVMAALSAGAIAVSEINSNSFFISSATFSEFPSIFLLFNEYSFSLSQLSVINTISFLSIFICVFLLFSFFRIHDGA